MVAKRLSQNDPQVPIQQQQTDPLTEGVPVIF